MLLRLQACGESLRFRDPFNLDRNCVYRGFYSLEPAVYRAQFTGWHRSWLEPFRDQTHDRETEHDRHDSGHYKGENRVDY
jgi:hypothetical protein